MKKELSKGIEKFFITLLFALFFLIFQTISMIIILIGGFLAKVDFGSSAENITNNILSFLMNYDEVIYILTAIFTIGFFLIIAKSGKIKIKEFLKVNKISKKIIALCILLGVALNIISDLLYNFLCSISKIKAESNVNLPTADHSNLIILTILVPIILAPIFEEILFRGIMFNYLKGDSKNKTVLIYSILFQSLMFGLGHAININLVIVTAIFGVINCLVYIWTKSIISNMIVHSSFNAFTIILVFTNLDIPNILFIILSIFSIVISILSLIYLYKKGNTNISKRV